jgi:biopolymer transport protein ExbD
MAASSAVKRQRKRRRIDTDGDPEFQVAPMVDVLLVLMLFFMAITSTEVLKKDPHLKLADAKHAKPAGHDDVKHQIIVNVKWDDANNVAQFTYNEQLYPSADAMTGVLAAAHQHDPLSYVLIRADKNVEYSNIADLMSACGNAGIASVSFAVLLNNNKPKAAGDASASN